LLWAADGKTTWEISQILGVSGRTVIFHFQNAADKLKVANRQQAVARAVAIGLISPSLG
jgi:DNA-binding CsgD family transcriptional regulator